MTVPVLDERRIAAQGLTWRDDSKAWLMRHWASLAAPPSDRLVPGTRVVVAIAFLVGVGASIVSIRTGANMAYEDAQSHLTIARRVTDSVAPGFTQLGTVWLPVPSLMLLPLVQSTLLWHTGWSAAILGTLALMGIAAAVYRIAARVGIGRPGRLLAVALLVLNPALVYLCTTGMSEPALILWIVASVAGLARWTLSNRTLSMGELMVFAGLPAAAATMSRYEGWALVLVMTPVVCLIGWRRQRSFKYALKAGTAFALWPGLAVTWWMSYNFTVYGNPLEFLNGPYSANSLQQSLSDAGLIAYQGNLGLTVWTFGWSLWQTIGLVTLVLGLMGAFVLAWTKGLDNRALMIWVLLSPAIFMIGSMFLGLGQTVIANDHSLPAGLWNSRYALSVLPALALLSAVLLERLRVDRVMRRIGTVVVIAAVVCQTGWWLADLDRSSVLAEASQYAAFKDVHGANAAATYLREHYKGGHILMDEGVAGNALLPEIGIPLSEYFNRAAGDLFQDAIDHPAQFVDWVFMTVPDALDPKIGNSNIVYSTLGNDPTFNSQYEVVFSDGWYRIYRRIGT